MGAKKKTSKKERKRLFFISVAIISLLSLLVGSVYNDWKQILLNRRIEIELTEKYEQLLEDEIRMFALDIAKRVSTFSADGFYKKAFLSAVTAKGFCNFFKENLENYYTLSVEAEVGDASYRLMQEVAAACRLRNVDMIVCPCPMNPHQIEHLLFPSANLALVTSNVYHSYSGADEIVSFGDFLKHRISGRTPQLMYDGILHLAIKAFSDALEHHNRLETLYQSVTDYSKIDNFRQKTLDFLLR